MFKTKSKDLSFLNGYKKFELESKIKSINFKRFLKNKFTWNIIVFYNKNVIKEIYDFKIENYNTDFLEFLVYFIKKYNIFDFTYECFINNELFDKNFYFKEISDNSIILLQINLKDSALSFKPNNYKIFINNIDTTIIKNFKISNNFGKIKFYDFINITNINFDEIIKIEKFSISLNYDVKNYFMMRRSFLKSKVKISFKNYFENFNIEKELKINLYDNLTKWVKKEFYATNFYFKFNKFYFSFDIKNLLVFNKDL